MKEGKPVTKEDTTYNRRQIGRLICLKISRPDICFVVHRLNQFIQKPTKTHVDDRCCSPLIEIPKKICGPSYSNKTYYLIPFKCLYLY